jgi:nucleotide-binding universal stress UspA family protein
MGRYKKILVAVDGSATSLHAFKEALRLDTSWPVVVSVAPPFEPFGGDVQLVKGQDIQSMLSAPCQLALGKAEDLARKPAVSIKTVCAVGEAHERIVELAQDEHCDLIVMGPKGHGVIEMALMGSVTRRVIGYSPVDVLVIPDKASLGWEKLLLATDGSGFSWQAAQKALNLAETYGSEIIVASIADIPPVLYAEAAEVVESVRREHQGYVSEVTAEAEKLNLKAAGFIPQGAPAKAITDLARQEKASLIIMGSHGRTGLKRLLMGSVTERVIGQAPCPVLVVKGGAER